ncbi:hypothetical protein LOZ61_001715 [Ophidiomyces ophidiicola]|uniref:uncharacterized protein n=1 Tax=Ophidiomyces ophidiicola TaxID=1387563 RepID=UPI0020C52506|nr:uncharacterized protein LOZ57_000978 [Ophidiomyces ophidiicola]KAI1912931.1 hypothetical protein LOZ64_004256 [Ophidiomyces ophidiicola]KAI1915317.1 hypothetical protein LOZ61_001715 [Ophidiomyces ophidiicola]KAI1921457.1 hypothetical protein LOZ60_006176 [Ophidiomyces ophidiicola]KAI1952895.1 hypothetical protein LOZ57_000978 [Ophidiomyces ophidiicola]KAI2001661.1 hypothetical protein LOZ49_006565 [Ophidiomyces ophidiicola]
MPRAEVGSIKHLSNKLKSKGLQRLRWYCQVCERQMRDENGFKCHTQSESHVRQMLLVGEDPKKFIAGYSNDFLRDFLQLLRTSHGEKQVNINHFYQEYIANKEHIHMNATKWSSLTEFAKHLGREGICRVEEGEKGIFISWIDNSPEALRRQDAIRKKERQDRGEEERERKLIEEQIKRAHRDKETTGENGDDLDTVKELQRVEGEKIKLNFAMKTTLLQNFTPTDSQGDSDLSSLKEKVSDSSLLPTAPGPPKQKAPTKLGSTSTSKPKNVFASMSKKTASPKSSDAPSRPLSAIEKVMKEDMERKRARGSNSFGTSNTKRQKIL